MFFRSFSRIRGPGAFVVAITFFPVFFFAACTSQEDKCANLRAELINTYNAYIDEEPSVTVPGVMRQCEDALKECPDLTIAYELMGMLELDRGNAKVCVRHYKKALELAPTDEVLLSDARAAALSANREYLYIDETGRVQSMNFAEISLEEYAELAENVRLTWCEINIEAIQANLPLETEETVLVDQNGEQIDVLQTRMEVEVFSPEEMDVRLLSEAQSDPERTVGDASFGCALGEGSIVTY